MFWLRLFVGIKCPTIIFSPTGWVNLPCPGTTDGWYPDYSHCGYFLICTNMGIPMHARVQRLACPAGLYFNPVTIRCDYPVNVPSCRGGSFVSPTLSQTTVTSTRRTTQGTTTKEATTTTTTTTTTFTTTAATTTATETPTDDDDNMGVPGKSELHVKFIESKISRQIVKPIVSKRFWSYNSLIWMLQQNMLVTDLFWNVNAPDNRSKILGPVLLSWISFDLSMDK